jgi:uncharacterized protein YbaP (TraB family)
MTRIKIFVVCIYLVLASTATHADVGHPKQPAAWAWEINSPQRKIYLLGEAHSIVGPSNLNIDYQLGQDAYRKSIELWTEFDGMGVKNKYANLVRILKPETWDKVTDIVKKTINNFEGMSYPQKNSLSAEVIDDLNKETAYGAYVILGVLSSSLPANKKTNFQKRYMGLGAKLKLSERLDYDKKRKFIEDASSISDSWQKNCDTAEKSEQFINVALHKFVSLAPVTKTTEEKILESFLEEVITIESFHSLFLSDLNGAVIEECIIRPRNLLWLPKIVNALQTKGEAITVLVGIGHIGGNQGLLALLQKEGYTDIKRIYSISEL